MQEAAEVGFGYAGGCFRQGEPGAAALVLFGPVSQQTPHPNREDIDRAIERIALLADLSVIEGADRLGAGYTLDAGFLERLLERRVSCRLALDVPAFRQQPMAADARGDQQDLDAAAGLPPDQRRDLPRRRFGGRGWPGPMREGHFRPAGARLPSSSDTEVTAVDLSLICLGFFISRLPLRLAMLCCLIVRRPVAARTAKPGAWRLPAASAGGARQILGNGDKALGWLLPLAGGQTRLAACDEARPETMAAKAQKRLHGRIMPLGRGKSNQD